MNTYLSKTQINSYCGNVVPLKLKSHKDLSCENIKWSVVGDSVTIKEFKDSVRHPFNDGILVTLINAGKSKIVCEYDGEKYECNVNVSEKRTASASDVMNVYPADLHIHTSNDHNRETFPLRTEETADNCIKTTFESGAVECSVLTDHAGTTNVNDFFKGFIADEETNHEGLIVFPGAESEISYVEKDRYGTDLRCSGEIVTINASDFSNTRSWEDFYGVMSNSPFAIASLAHPLIAGWSTLGIWNFKFYKNFKTAASRRLVRLIEVGRGDYSVTSMLYHYGYSQALDAGLKVSPCSTSDSHGNYKPCVGKTFIVSPEKSKEMFYDAIINNRVYACDSGAVKFNFTVNECIMGQTLKPCDTYKFHVEASLLRDEPDARPVKCTVVSDYGEKIYTCKFEDKADFEIKSDTARYFYIILTDITGKKLWSSPIWTGREFDDFSAVDNLKPIDKSGFKVTDEKTGNDASILVNDNPFDAWCANDKTASVIIDMCREEKISAVGHIAPAVNRVEASKNNIDLSKIVTQYASRCRVSVSCDGNNYSVVKEATIREFGGEDMLFFDEVNARYVKFEVLETVGADTERADLKDAVVKIAELSIFKNKSL